MPRDAAFHQDLHCNKMVVTEMHYILEISICDLLNSKWAIPVEKNTSRKNVMTSRNNEITS